MSRNAASVAAAMSARAVVARAGLLAALLAALPAAQCEEISCTHDGLFADFSTDCQEYVRCANGAVTARYACSGGRVFSGARAQCVPRDQLPCVRRRCAPADTRAYAAPGTACRLYYRCDNGSAVEHACPADSWFDVERQACTRGAGTCYEPVCAGLPDGGHPDPSHECRRALECRGGELRGVGPAAALVAGPAAAPAACPAPRSAAAALPAGDADFCSDEACASLCERAADGAYADRAAGCREYFVCEARRVVRRGVCEPGRLFAGARCLPAALVACPPPARSPCFNRADGPHRDWRDCRAWFECRRERVVARGACPPGLAFDGASCSPADAFYCEGPEPAAECEGLPSGMYQDAESNCTRYFHCEGSSRIRLSCPAGQMFDGARCVAGRAEACPALARDSCWRRADGRYRAAGAGCRAYYACAAGDKAMYACAPHHVFDGETCVPRRAALCPRDDASCRHLSDGYHPELESGCSRYFYCEGGDRLATLSCLGDKRFDGQACVEAGAAACGRARGAAGCARDGFFPAAGGGCARYYFCVGGERTELACPPGRLFNGQVCVPRDHYTCPE